MTKALLTTAAFLLISLAQPIYAITWSTTELHLQHGELEQVGSDGAETDNLIITLHHVHGWEFGRNFFFIDYFDAHSDGNGRNPFNPGSDRHYFYGEGYSTVSLGKITGSSFALGIVKDVGLTLGVNIAESVDSWWLLPGVTFALDLPGFNFANFAALGYLNHSYADRNDSEFKVLDESNTYMFDFSWDYPFKIGRTSWTLTGHIEYIKGRSQHSTVGKKQLASWVLAQPQLRLDIGEWLFNKKGQLYAGIEYQYWHNKLGEKGTHDNEAQLLAVWRF
jgi:hypothetical protein